MQIKDYTLGECRSRATQSAVALIAIAKRYSNRHKSRWTFSSRSTVAYLTSTCVNEAEQANLLLDRSARITAIDFRFNFNRFSDREALMFFDSGWRT